MDNHEAMAPFWDHVLELRRVLFVSLLCVVTGIGTAFLFYPSLLDFFTAPLAAESNQKFTRLEIKREKLINQHIHPLIYTGNEIPRFVSIGTKLLTDGKYLIPKGEFIEIEKETLSHSLVILGPGEGFSTVIKICLWAGLIASSPAWGFMLLRFIYPALGKNEKNLVPAFIFFTILSLIGGIVSAYYCTIPLANQYFTSFNQAIGINLWSMANYLDYSLFLFFANVFVFEIGSILFFMVHLGIVSAAMMAEGRRYAIISAFILGAFLTPPDILTQLLIAIPLILLYEAAIIYARWREKLKTPILEFLHE